MKIACGLPKIKALFINNLLTVLLSFVVASAATAFIRDFMSSEELIIRFEKPFIGDTICK